MSTNVPSSLEETEIFQNNDNLVDFFDNACQRHKDQIAFESFDVGMSYTQLSNQVNALALWLSKHFNVGDKVAVMMPNMLAYPVIVYGVIKAGMIVVNINPLYTKRELEHVLKDSEARLLLCWEGAAHVVASSDLGNVDQVVLTTVGDLLGFKGKIINFVVRKIKKLVPKFTLQNTLTFSQVLRENAKESFTNIELSHDQAAFLQYTGGTTGVSKGAILSHRNIMANTAQAYYVTNPKLYEDVDKDQTIAICPLPLYHIFALLAHNFLMFYFGAKNVLITNPRDLPTFVSIFPGRRRLGMTENEQATLEQALMQFGVPAEKAPEMAAQLDKRAQQLAETGGRTYEQALMHLLQLMKTAHEERDQHHD